MRGFTLLEVVLALVILEVAVVGAVGTLTLASRNLGSAERLERAVAAAEGILDSLAGVADPQSGSGSYPGFGLSWSIDGERRIALRASGADPSLQFEIYSALPGR